GRPRLPRRSSPEMGWRRVVFSSVNGAPVSIAAMADATDTANVIIRPTIAWAVAVLAGLALNWLLPLPFVPAAVPAGWLGAIVFFPSPGRVAWGLLSFSPARSHAPTAPAPHPPRLR